MNLSKFFDSEWVRLSQRLQQSINHYRREAREREETKGGGSGCRLGETGRRRPAGLPDNTARAGDAAEAGEAALGAAGAGAATAADTPKHNTKLRPSVIAVWECSKMASSIINPESRSTAYSVIIYYLAN
ncbi:unnamed protein product [Linum trigynum]|uniref:Uncharacterized protein n=1 Tax=Linum trigynum TaxID=586398 RepID=A0AAV2FDR6_9ROSI